MGIFRERATGQAVNREHCATLLSIGIMPKAIVAVFEPDSDAAYSLNGRFRLAGLPILDLDERVRKHDSLPKFIAATMLSRHGANIVEIKMPPRQTIPLPQSAQSISRYHPDAKSEIFFPVFATMDDMRTSRKPLTAAPLEQIVLDQEFLAEMRPEEPRFQTLAAIHAGMAAIMAELTGQGSPLDRAS